MEFEKSVSFKNWSLTKFEGLFGGDFYKFEAGKTYNVPLSLALHFAKQLAVRELHALGTVKGEMLSEPDVKEYMDRCFPVKLSAVNEPNTFEEVTDGEAIPAIEPENANKTIQDEQSEESDDDDADTSDEKNNAGAPVFKNKGGRPRKDAQYVK